VVRRLEPLTNTTRHVPLYISHRLWVPAKYECLQFVHHDLAIRLYNRLGNTSQRIGFIASLGCGANVKEMRFRVH